MDNNNVIKYPFVVLFNPEGEKGYVAYAPDLPGCITCGEDETINNNLILNCSDALKSWVEIFKEENSEIPKPSKINDIKQQIAAKSSLVIPITLD